MPEDKYPKQLFNQSGILKGEWLDDIKHGASSSASFFMACVDEYISSRRFKEGLSTKVKLDIYKWFGKSRI